MLVVCIIGLALFAIFYLRRRQLTTYEYIAWGLLALLLPILGPYIVIASRPGEPPSKSKSSYSSET
ncbi:MAG: hypothetical protein DWQ07_10410 [Chloroflexi bacterium]|nr:MAG: hypothetical protein DWQ07_10410 [Chloroflexota bacterium]MBL1192876.1 hypothetical protein [Chloroflexota bacterium]